MFLPWEYVAPSPELRLPLAVPFFESLTVLVQNLETRLQVDFLLVRKKKYISTNPLIYMMGKQILLSVGK